MARSITSTDAIFYLTIPGVYDTPQVLQGYATDDMFDLEAKPKVEVRFGIDGIQSAGFIKTNKKMKIKLEATSDSMEVFDNWAAAMDFTEDAIPCFGVITMLGNGSEYTLTNGQLTGYKDMPDAKKTLQPVTYEITWESVIKSQV